jgi:hypothetical protein
VTTPILQLQGAMRLVFEALKLAGRGALWVAIQISKVWNGIIDAIQSVLSTIADFEVLGARPFAALDGLAWELGNARLPVQEMQASLAELNRTTWDNIDARARETAATERNAAATNAATEALLNVPSGYRVALARFNATTPGAPGSTAPSSPTAPGPGVGASPPPGRPSDGTSPYGPAPGTAQQVVNVFPRADMDEESLAAEVVRIQARVEARASGNRMGYDKARYAGAF